MDLSPFFKSIIDQDRSQIVICNLSHDIIYMNPEAIDEYSDAAAGQSLVGRSIMDCHPHWANERIVQVVDWFSKSQDNNIVHTFYDAKRNKDVYMVALRDDSGNLIGYYEKHESRNKDDMPVYKM